MRRKFDVKFSVSGEKMITLYDDNEASARTQAANCTWDEIISGVEVEDAAADLDVWCKIEVVSVEDR
jgi:hypothetical protein